MLFKTPFQFSSYTYLELLFIEEKMNYSRHTNFVPTTNTDFGDGWESETDALVDHKIIYS